MDDSVWDMMRVPRDCYLPLMLCARVPSMDLLIAIRRPDILPLTIRLLTPKDSFPQTIVSFYGLHSRKRMQCSGTRSDPISCLKTVLLSRLSTFYVLDRFIFVLNKEAVFIV
jgi:hypothetical protein